MTTAAMGERETRRHAALRAMVAAGAFLALLWVVLTGFSIANEPWIADTPDPLNVGFEPLAAIGIAAAALSRRRPIGVLVAAAMPCVAVASEFLRALVLAVRTDGSAGVYVTDLWVVAFAVLVYFALIPNAMVIVERPRSLLTTLALTIVLLPFAALTLLWISEPGGLLSAALAAASGLWLVAILGISRPLPR